MSIENVLSWVAPTKNTDGSAIAAAEITGYTVGVRGASSGAAGTYPYTKEVAPTVLSFDLKTFGLAPGNYVVAVETNSANNSSWSVETAFTIPVPIPTPLPPSGFSLA